MTINNTVKSTFKKESIIAHSCEDEKSSIPPAHSEPNTEAAKAIQHAREALRPASDKPLTRTIGVMAMQLWNKVLAFQGAFAEAAALQWRVEACNALESPENTKHGSAINMVEANEDPLAKALGARLPDLPDILLGFLDASVRSVCPHAQTVQREAYRPIAEQHTINRVRGEELTLECETVEDYCNLFAVCGIPPRAAAALVRAVLWSVETHTPYAKTDDRDDLERGFDSAIGVIITQKAAIPFLNALEDRMTRATDPVFSTHLPSVWRQISSEERNVFCERFYHMLFSSYPHLEDYFSRSEMDVLTDHLTKSLNFIFGASRDHFACGSFRHALEQLAIHYKSMSVPTYAYPLVGTTLADAFQPYIEREVQSNPRIKDAAALRKALLVRVRDITTIMHFPMYNQERLLSAAREFISQVSEELNWTDAQLKQRMLTVENEVITTGTYTHTADELRVGARLAWRNSSKCIGRISWNTLIVRDCRHVDDPEGIFREVGNHLRLATSGTNIQSVMTVFRPKPERQALGTRFWSAQFHRYAGYKNGETGEVLGDSANVEMTEYLIDNKLWNPPGPRTAFDVLPVVLKRNGVEKPDVYRLPEELLFEVDIEHPTNEKVNALKYKWCTVPAISNFKMTLGGLTYQNMPFNGWFMSTEIVRNLIERYDAGPAVAAACGIDTQKELFWRQQVSLELERAVNHSFNKNGYTIVDPMSAGQSFCTHVQREREEHGRECPAQWSWIGGLVGPTNPTWHLEMRDFLVKPQYEYCTDGLKFHTANHQNRNATAKKSEDVSVEGSSSVIVPRVLIVYGSETGNAERVARKLKRELRTLRPRLCNLNDAAGFSVSTMKKFSHVLAICSTFGNGEPPSNAKKFFESDKIEFVNAKFAVLGLGSTIYPNFCKAGVGLDRMLASCDLERLCAITKVDDTASPENTISEWITAMKTLIISPSVERQISVGSSNVEKIEYRMNWRGSLEKEKCEADGSFGALCLSNTELLTALDPAEGSVRQITFKAPSSFVTGDHISVQPMNSDSNVQRFLYCFRRELLKAHLSRKVENAKAKDVLRKAEEEVFDIECVEGTEIYPADLPFSTPNTLGHIIREKLEFTLNSTSAVDLLSLVGGRLEEIFKKIGAAIETELISCNELLHELLSDYENIVAARDESDSPGLEAFLGRFPSVIIFLEYFSPILFHPLHHNGALVHGGQLLLLVDILSVSQSLRPRYYSISSSNRQTPDKITITVGVLRSINSEGETVHGTCSNYLASLVPGKDRARITVRTSTFRLPKDDRKPIIMVGAGTGLSPLMGFLSDRAMSCVPKCVGNMHLFFGCRTGKHFIYESRIKKYEDEGMLNLQVAISRPPGGDKQYVQDRINAEEERMNELLMLDDTHYYVCGDVRMAEACREACVNVLRRKAGMSRVNAIRHLNRMQAEGRWQSDVWGIMPKKDSTSATKTSKIAAVKAWNTTFHAL